MPVEPGWHRNTITEKGRDAFGVRAHTSQSGSGRLTVSAARTNVALFIHRAVRPSGLHRAEAFWNSRSHGFATV
jgi:hypothetical protein